MANIKNRNIYRGSSKNYDPTDPRRSSAVEMFNVDLIADNLDNALLAGAAKFFGGTKVGGQILPLQSIKANWVDNTKALCTAKFGHRSSRAAGGFEGISLSTGTGSARWIQLPYDKDKNPAFSADGRPAGKLKLNEKQTISKQWVWKMSIWVIDIKITLRSNPASQVGQYLATINSDPITWDGFKFPAKTLKFKGADIKYVRNGYQVAYTFAHRRDGWYEQWPAIKKGEDTFDQTYGSTKEKVRIPGKDEPDYVTSQMFQAVSYTSPGFPDSRI